MGRQEQGAMRFAEEDGGENSLIFDFNIVSVNTGALTSPQNTRVGI